MSWRDVATFRNEKFSSMIFGRNFGYYSYTSVYIGSWASCGIHNSRSPPQTIEKLCSREFCQSSAIFPPFIPERVESPPFIPDTWWAVARVYSRWPVYIYTYISVSLTSYVCVCMYVYEYVRAWARKIYLELTPGNFLDLEMICEHWEEAAISLVPEAEWRHSLLALINFLFRWRFCILSTAFRTNARNISVITFLIEKSRSR